MGGWRGWEKHPLTLIVDKVSVSASVVEMHDPVVLQCREEKFLGVVFCSDGLCSQKTVFYLRQCITSHH